jgi:hypothetical protein
LTAIDGRGVDEEPTIRREAPEGTLTPPGGRPG